MKCVFDRFRLALRVRQHEITTCCGEFLRCISKLIHWTVTPGMFVRELDDTDLIPGWQASGPQAIARDASVPPACNEERPVLLPAHLPAYVSL